MGTDGFADSNFFDPLGDRNEHNIHNADSSDKQRNCGNTSKERGQHSGNTTYGANHIALTLNREISCRRWFES